MIDSFQSIEEKYDQAKSALENWAFIPLISRIDALLHFQDILDKQREELAETISSEIGKPLWECKQEIQAVINKIPISIEAYKARCPDRSIEQNNAYVTTRHKPHGVAAVIGPFNFPLHLPNGHIIPALLAGNTVLFKPSEKAVKSAELYTKLFLEAGFPDNVLQIVRGGPKEAEFLLDLPIDAVYFTGSLPVGLKIERKFIDKPYVIVALEMGGMNSLVISDISDIHAASYQTIQSAFITSGQRCSSARKLIVIDSKKNDAYLKELLHMVSNLVIGDPSDRPEPFMGPLISEEAADHVFETFQKQKGKVIYPMKRLGKRLLTPGIIEVDPFDIKDEEVFGPLLYLIRVPDFAQAIRETNRTKYGLTAGLFSDSMDEYEAFFKQVKAGIINWNTPTTGASSYAPFGGVKMSGNHRPSAFYAADYTAYPVASTESEVLRIPTQINPGIQGVKK